MIIAVLRHRLRIPWLALLALPWIGIDAVAQPAGSSENTLVYETAFFERYRPVNARDMVEQVPGFQISDGASRRGFGAASGNVLINGRRPSSKTDRVSDILERIPAAQVLRIELIRGNIGRFGSGGQTQLANVVLDTGQRAWNWESRVEQDLDSGGPTPALALSVVDRRERTEWGLGLELSTSFIGNEADEVLFEGDRISEQRSEFERYRNQSVRLNANSQTTFERSRLNLNLELRYRDDDFRENSRRTPQNSNLDPFNLDQRGDTDHFRIEVGSELSWSASPDWSADFIGLLRRESIDNLDQRLLGPARDRLEITEASDQRTLTAETIGRIQLDWSGLERHLLELDVEAALNRLDNTLQLFGRTADGWTEIIVPGGNNEVEELRGELSLRDTWTGSGVSIESALDFEVSQLSQRDASAPDRRFFFFKPSLTLVHSATAGRVDRIRLRREIAQLDFSDFVSASNFGDADIDRGNPDLEPQQDWLLQVSSEQRFGDLGSARLTLFHRWVQDVQDRLPVEGQFEVPGNIGDGRRWGAALEGTAPLDVFGMKQARIDFETRWERSRVTDPVTGRSRRFSGQRHYEIETTVRQDLPALRMAWGVETEYEDHRAQFELDEIDRNASGLDLEPFIEWTRWGGVKMRLTLQNLLDRRFERDRRIFEPDRNAGDPRFRELRDRRRGRSLLLEISGSF